MIEPDDGRLRALFDRAAGLSPEGRGEFLRADGTGRPAAPTPAIPGYEILGELGRGAHGRRLSGPPDPARTAPAP